MSETVLPKDICDSISRNFNLWFTRSTMYHLDHPATHQALNIFFTSVTDGLKVQRSRRALVTNMFLKACLLTM